MKDQTKTVIQWGAPLGNKSRTFSVFGVARGGTSAVAGIMRMLGIYMGDNLDNNHEDPRFIGTPNPARIEAIKERNEQRTVWGWKDPNAANYLRFMQPHLVNPHYICVFRDNVSIGIAQKRWHNRETRFAMGDIFAQQQKNLFWIMTTDAPALLVSYEKLLASPIDFAHEIAEFTGVRMNLPERDVREFLAPGSYKEVA